MRHRRATVVRKSPERSTQRFGNSLLEMALEGIGLHSLRHSHGSRLLSAGVPITVVSKRLGHSSVAITAAIYSHSFTRDEIAAAEAWEATMRRVVSPGGKDVARQ